MYLFLGKMIRCAIFLVLILKEVTPQVCNDTISVLRNVDETYRYTYYEAYEDEDCVIWCVRSKMAVNIGTRQVEKLVNETVNVCCEGYTMDYDYLGDGIKCVPLCNPPCENGYCRNPNECACESGYAIDPNDALKRCVPLCLVGCSTPDCLSTCQVSESYSDVAHVGSGRVIVVYDPETDMCDGECSNGTCVASGVCHCNSGFKRVLRSCEPVCTSCEHGKCVAPEQCECDFGYYKECGSCKPICSGCEHGKCKAPGQCECNPGYKAINANCEPFCSDCSGVCVAPDLCACEPGWYMDRASMKCEPHCDVACGNGSCVVPNICSCYTGYREKFPQEDTYNEAPRCVPDCTNCSGICVAPGICKCETGFEPIYTTIDGTECDCFSCDDVSKKCDKITCRKLPEEESIIRSIDLSHALPVQPYDASEESVDLDNKTQDEENFMKVIDLSQVSQVINEADATEESVDLDKETLDSIKNPMNDTCNNSKTVKFTYHWVYITIIIIELLLIIVMLVILERKHLMYRLKTNKFEPKGEIDDVAVHYSSSVTCSKLKNMTESDSP